MEVGEEELALLVGVAALLDMTPAILQQLDNRAGKPSAGPGTAPSSSFLPALQAEQLVPKPTNLRVAVAKMEKRPDLLQTDGRGAPELPADGLDQGLGHPINPSSPPGRQPQAGLVHGAQGHEGHDAVGQDVPEEELPVSHIEIGAAGDVSPIEKHRGEHGPEVEQRERGEAKDWSQSQPGQEVPDKEGQTEINIDGQLAEGDL